MLTIKQAYLTAFCMLQYHYWEPRKHEEGMYQDERYTLVDLVSHMNPYMLFAGTSSDPAYWECDWPDAVKKVTRSILLTHAEALQACIVFVEYYAAAFDFDVQWVLDDMKTLSPDGDLWMSYIETALETEKWGIENGLDLRTWG